MECIYRNLCCYKYNNNEHELDEYLINNTTKTLKVNCLYIKSKTENNIFNIDLVRSRIGRNIPKFLPIELLDYSMEYLICIDAMFDIKDLLFFELKYSIAFKYGSG